MKPYLLPDEFKDLDSFTSGWALSTEEERNKKRLASSMQEIRAFYDAVCPRLGEILHFLQQFPVEKFGDSRNMPEEVRRLLQLAMSLVEVSPAVELFGQPGVIDGFDIKRFVPHHKYLGE